MGTNRLCSLKWMMHFKKYNARKLMQLNFEVYVYYELPKSLKIPVKNISQTCSPVLQ